MAANLPVIDIDGSHTEQKRKVLQEADVHAKPFIETSSPPFPFLGRISDKGEIACQIPQLPRNTQYDYLSAKSVQPSAEMLLALKKGYMLWMSGRVQSNHINDRHPHLHFVKGKYLRCATLDEEEKDTYINHAMCQQGE